MFHKEILEITLITQTLLGISSEYSPYLSQLSIDGKYVTQVKNYVENFNKSMVHREVRIWTRFSS